jgi:hypothetical protein
MPLIIRIACAAAILLASQSYAADLHSQVERYRLAQEADIAAEIAALTRLKSVAAEPAGLAATAHALEAALKSRGFEVSWLSTGTNSPPMVFGLLMTPMAQRTVLFYDHYDGQPVTPAQWSSPSFVPVMSEHALSDKLTWDTGYPALRSDMSSPAAKAVIAAASGCRICGMASTLTRLMAGLNWSLE